MSIVVSGLEGYMKVRCSEFYLLEIEDLCPGQSERALLYDRQCEAAHKSETPSLTRCCRFLQQVRKQLLETTESRPGLTP